jgi:hypothetical protein
MRREKLSKARVRRRTAHEPSHPTPNMSATPIRSGGPSSTNLAQDDSARRLPADERPQSRTTRRRQRSSPGFRQSLHRREGTGTAGAGAHDAATALPSFDQLGVQIPEEVKNRLQKPPIEAQLDVKRQEIAQGSRSPTCGRTCAKAQLAETCTKRCVRTISATTTRALW